jgi:hypothetical protein
VQDKLKSVAKDQCPSLEPRPVQAWEMTTGFIEIPYFPPSPVLALKAVSQLLRPDKDREVPGFPVRCVGVDELHAAFLNESRTRGRRLAPRTGNPGVWFSLGENHEEAFHFGLHPLQNCPRDTPKMPLRFLANTTPLPESAAV